MAKKQTKLDTLVAVADLIKEEPKKEKNKKRILSKQTLESNETVKNKYNKYVKTVKAFIADRNMLIEDKYELQKELNEWLLKKERIVKSTFWDFKLDKDGNMEYKNSPKSYVEKRLDYYIRTEKSALFDDNIFSADDEKEGTGEQASDDAQDTSEGTSEGTSKETVAGVKTRGLGKETYKPADNATDEEAQHWYELNAKSGLPGNWEERPAVELNTGGKARAKQHQWKTYTA